MFVLIMPLGPKMTPPSYQGSHSLYRFICREVTMFLSETARPRTLLLSMKYHLAGFKQVCPYYASGAKMDPHE